MEIKAPQFIKNPDTKNLKNLLLIVGDEALLKSMVVEKLKEIIPLKSFWGDEVNFDEVMNDLKVQSLFGQPPSILIRDAKEFISKLSKEQLSILLKTLPSLSSQRLVLLFIEEELPRTDPYKKLYQMADIILCSKLTKQAFITSLKKKLDREGLDIKQEDLDYLATLLNYDLSLAKQEVEKLIVYCKDKGFIGREDIDNLITSVSESNIFEFIELFIKADRRCVEVASKLIDKYLHPFQIQSVLFTQLEKVLYYKLLLSQGLEQDDIFGRLKVSTPIQKSNIQRYSKLLSADTLEKFILELYQLELDQKVYYKDVEREFLKFIIKSLMEREVEPKAS